jgi:hypothetical protein
LPIPNCQRLCTPMRVLTFLPLQTLPSIADLSRPATFLTATRLLVPSAITMLNVEAHRLPLPLRLLDAMSWPLRYSVQRRRRRRLTPHSANRSWSFAPPRRADFDSRRSVHCDLRRSVHFDLRHRPSVSVAFPPTCSRALQVLVRQVLVQKLDRQAASLPEVFCPFDGRVTVALLSSASCSLGPSPQFAFFKSLTF